MRQSQPRRPHLSAALASLVCLLAGLAGFNHYSRGREQTYIDALAHRDLPEMLNGLALQQAALRQPDLLVVFGSSEVTQVNTSYEANLFFKNYPTGFAVMDVAKAGASALTMAQDLAGLGPDLRGKSIVISLAPGTFLSQGLEKTFYEGNYSKLHAYSLIFSPQLNPDLKQAAARSMLVYDATAGNDPFLRFTLNALAGSSPWQRSLYFLAWPLGELQVEIMHLQDHANVLGYLQAHEIRPEVDHLPQTINWDNLLGTSRLQQIQATPDNAYGVTDRRLWAFDRKVILRHPLPGSADALFISRLSQSREWQDLGILFDVLQQMGARPLILSRPMNVRLWEAMGVSPAAQNTYYVRLQQLAGSHHFPLIDFQTQGTDIYFSVDQWGHTSPEGWIYIDQVLDKYFHGKLH